MGFKLCLVWLVSVLASVSSLAQPRAPTDIELKAGYCLGVAKSQIDIVPHGDFPIHVQTQLDKFQAEATDRSNRLKAYLVPKLDVVDFTGIFAANSRAKVDVDLSRNDPEVTACILQCLDKSIAKDRLETCTKTCTSGIERYSRIESCKILNWLPF